MTNINDQRVKLVDLALKEFRYFSLESNRTTTSADIDRLMKRNNLANCSLGIGGMAGWTAAGLRYIDNLARSFRAGPPDKSQVVSNDVLSNHIRKKMMETWNLDVSCPTDSEKSSFLIEVCEWIDSHDGTRTFLVPCRISPFSAPPFRMGPVLFTPLKKYAAPTDSQNIYRYLLEMAKNGSADWIAEVKLYGREQEQACASADLAVDVALGALQALCGSGAFHKASRVTGRLTPGKIVQCWKEADGPDFGIIRSNDPGLGAAGNGLGEHLRVNHRCVEALGERIEGYVSGEGNTPGIDTSWCNAAYWYHDALSENLETLAVAKLVVAAEVLLRAESSSRSLEKLRKAIGAILGLSQDHRLDGMGISIQELIKKIKSIRGRVLHGTWFALQPDLPADGVNLPRFDTVESLVRALLVNSAVLITEYAKSASPTDDVNAFIKWAETKRSAA